MPALSIIVPVYKTEKYLPKCIDSILAQTFVDFELILIDDGSPDHCGEICDEYALKDGRIIVIHQENKGVSAARNAGLDIARGEYIGFVDSDDRIDEGFNKAMIEQARKHQADIVTCAMMVCDADGSPKKSILNDDRIYNSEQMMLELFNTPDKLGGSCCNKLFLKTAVSDLRFSKGMPLYEDRMFLMQAYRLCEKNVKIQAPLYYVTENPDSTTRTYSVDSLFSIVAGSRMIMKTVRRNASYYESAATNRYLDDSIRYLSKVKQTTAVTGEKCFVRKAVTKLRCIGTIIRSWMKNVLPKNKLHGYMLGIIGC